ncbi:unnamed protein product [Blepharisma stoltei]|uniref:Uncharacterized protein n=1 Tax=Blepharisma stoltei TaxID=1481888 RepID=A0AAU9K513_9CILI|nr:unnamed protein product [Blepharisma stoltei]
MQNDNKSILDTADTWNRIQSIDLELINCSTLATDASVENTNILSEWAEALGLEDTDPDSLLKEYTCESKSGNN